MDHRDFAALLAGWRRRRGFSQRDAAAALRVSKRTLQNWEQRRAMPQGVGLRAILGALRSSGAEEEELAGGIGRRSAGPGSRARRGAAEAESAIDVHLL